MIRIALFDPNSNFNPLFGSAPLAQSTKNIIKIDPRIHVFKPTCIETEFKWRFKSSWTAKLPLNMKIHVTGYDNRNKLIVSKLDKIGDDCDGICFDPFNSKHTHHLGTQYPGITDIEIPA